VTQYSPDRAEIAAVDSEQPARRHHPALALIRSTGFRLAALFATLLAISSLAVIGFIRFATTESLTRATDTAIRADVDSLAERYRSEGLTGLVVLIRTRVRDNERIGAVYALADPTGDILAGNIASFPPVQASDDGFLEFPVARNGEKSVIRLRLYGLPGGFKLLVGRDAEERIELRRFINETLLTSLILTTLLAVAGGWLLRRMVLRRVDAIRRTTEAIVGGDMSQRLAHRDTPDEFDLLAETINDMLNRLERLMDGVRDVSNAIAHDLRTPLARVRARIEEMSRAPAQPDTNAGAYEAVLDDIDELLRTFNALLRIAEVDAGARRSTFAMIDVASVLEDVADLYRAVAEEEGVELSLTAAPADLRLLGDGQLLAQALGNLIDNAIKYAKDGKVVAVTAARQGTHAAITVADRGPGIPPADRGRVIERFYRGERSRSRPGSGLGLSLVAAVARLHGGRLELHDNEPGLRAVLLLPA
jgi:signal transduction histidine kinase